MPTSPITSIGQIAIPVHDVDRAVAFYRDVLGLDFLFDAGPLAFLMCGDVRIMLTRPESKELDHPSSILYFRVDDIDARFRDLVAAGVTPQGQPHLIHRHEESGDEEWMAFFDDSEGNTLALMSRLAGDEAPTVQAD